jgi:hypothetical protein
VDGIVAEASGIVGVGVTARDGEDSLAEKLDELMVDLAGLPAITKTPGKTLRELQPSIGRLEQHGAAVGAALGLVKAGDEGLVEQIREQNGLLRARIRRHEASAWFESSLAAAFYHKEASSSSAFVNNPG